MTMTDRATNISQNAGRFFLELVDRYPRESDAQIAVRAVAIATLIEDAVAAQDRQNYGPTKEAP